MPEVEEGHSKLAEDKSPCAICTHITNFTALVTRGNARTPTGSALSELTLLQSFFVLGAPL